MAPVFDHMDEERVTRAESRRRKLARPYIRDINTSGSDDILSGVKLSRQDRSGPIPPRDNLEKHKAGRDDQGEPDSDDDDDHDDDRQRNQLQQGPDEDDDDHEDGRNGRGQTQALTSANLLTVDPLTAIPAAFTSNPLSGLASFLPTLTAQTSLPSELSTLRTSSVSSTSTPTPTPTLTPTSTSRTISTLGPLPTLSDASAPVAINPQVVTVSSVIVMTTTSVMSASTASPSSSSSSSSSFITSLFPPSTIIPTPSVTAAYETTAPSPTIFISDNDGPDKHDESHNDRNGPQPGGLSPTAEDVLISAGSIGAFILICFVCWMGWRMFKKHERAKLGMDVDDFSTPNALLAKIPYFGRNQRAWQDLDAADMRGSAPMYETSVKSAAMGPTVSIYSANSRRNVAQPSARQGPMVLPQLDTNVAVSPSFYAQVNPFSATATSSSPSSSLSGTPQSRGVQSPQNPSALRNFPHSEQYPAALTQIQTNFSPVNMVHNPFASPEDAAAAADLSPNSATQYGGEGTMQTFATSGTDRSRMPGYFNQSELARTASAAYDPATRAVYRASELSSLSSGFGDGDIIVPPPATLQQGGDPRPFSFAKSSGRPSRANSVAARSEAGSHGQRDTIYTTTSEDMPTRYRSVNSWVNQQTGRVERQQRRDSDEDVPPVPMLPPEQRLTMMMDDGEEPRRYEDTLSSAPPVPALPMKNVEENAK